MRPVKRRGNRRYYQHHEVLLIRRIRDLLYEQGFTINGARNRLDSHGSGRVAGGDESEQEPAPESAAVSTTAQEDAGGAVDVAQLRQALQAVID